MADSWFAGTCVAIVVVFVLVDTQLFPHLPDIGRVNFEAVLVLHILLNIIVAVLLLRYIAESIACKAHD